MSVGSAPASSYRDRTAELHSVAERLRRTQAGSAINSYHPASNGSAEAGARPTVPQASGSMQSEFSRKASRIGLSIHQTSQKLSKLAKLAKRTSMFDDPATEIQELTVVIKQDITALNAAISDLQELCDSRNDGGSQSKHSSEHSTTVVDSLKSKLMDTTKEFKDVLTMRTENLKVHENRRQLFSATAPKDGGNPFARQKPLGLLANGSSTSSAPPAPWENGSASGAHGSSSSSGARLFNAKELTASRRRPGIEAAATSSPRAQQAQMVQTQQLAVAQDSFLQSRAEALHNVESTIHELSNIFTQLATMVAQQGELAIRIDENMDNTLANVEGAQGALLKYLNRISSNRWLIIKIFFVLIAFLMILLLIL